MWPPFKMRGHESCLDAKRRQLAPLFTDSI
jgi:hypothetical protein